MGRCMQSDLSLTPQLEKKGSGVACMCWLRCMLHVMSAADGKQSIGTSASWRAGAVDKTENSIKYLEHANRRHFTIKCLRHIRKILFLLFIHYSGKTKNKFKLNAFIATLAVFLKSLCSFFAPPRLILLLNTFLSVF